MDVEQIAEAVFRGVESRIEKALAPVLERLEQLESVGVPTASDVARTILAGEEIKTLVDLHVTEAVEQMEPPKDGKDATEDDVRKAVADYLKENPPEKGRDGLDLKDLFRADGGHLIAVMSDGSTKDLGEYVGKNGKGIEDLVRFYDSEKHEIVERWGEKELRYPAGGIRPGDYWREGTKAVAASVWTHAGVAWIAKRDTAEKPSRDSADWQIFANKGRDGTDGRPGRDLGPPEPVKLRNGDA